YRHFVFFVKHSHTTPPTPLPLHDALPIYAGGRQRDGAVSWARQSRGRMPKRCLKRRVKCDRSEKPQSKAMLPMSRAAQQGSRRRSEEHTSELQSHLKLVCRLLLEKKNPTV